MIKPKEDMPNYLGTILFIVLFFLFVSAFSNKSVNQTSGACRYELQSEFHANSAKAIVADAIQLPSVQKICLSLLCSANFDLFSEIHKTAYTNKITQRFILLQQTRLLIKPLLLFRFCFCIIPPDTEELPVLS